MKSEPPPEVTELARRAAAIGLLLGCQCCRGVLDDHAKIAIVVDDDGAHAIVRCAACAAAVGAT